MHTFFLVIVASAAVTFPLAAQFRMSPDSAARASAQIDDPTKSEAIDCEVSRLKPFLDFSFRFSGGYIIRCPVRVFEGKPATVRTYVRITPAAGKPLLLQDTYSIPAMPPDMRPRTNIHALRNMIEISGGFSLGEGEYKVDLLITDNSERALRHHWRIKAVRNHSEREVEVVMKPDTVAPVSTRPWDGRPVADGKKVRITVLLDAAPTNPYSSKLHAWDRAFLLDSLSSLLRQIPWESVRLVAFNLDQQREIFREDKLDRPAFFRLARELRQLELGTVSYSVLKKQQGWADLLADITNREVLTDQPSDLVIFLGPVTRIAQKIPADILEQPKSNGPRFFYLEYYPVWRQGSEFSDSINFLTSARNGSTIKIHSPGELARGIQKMLLQVRP